MKTQQELIDAIKIEYYEQPNIISTKQFMEICQRVLINNKLIDNKTATITTCLLCEEYEKCGHFDTASRSADMRYVYEYII